MINVRHNKHIPLQSHFVTPYGISMLCPAVLYIHLLTGKSSASAVPKYHPNKINHFSNLLTCSSVDAYNLASQYTDGLWIVLLLFFRFWSSNFTESFNFYHWIFRYYFSPLFHKSFNWKNYRTVIKFYLQILFEMFFHLRTIQPINILRYLNPY
jgi:hypothetical protein